MPLLIVFIRPIIVALLLGAAAVATQAVDSDVVPQSAAATASVSELIGPSVTVEVLESRIKEVSAYDGLLAERLLWIRSAPPMGMAALTSLPYPMLWFGCLPRPIGGRWGMCCSMRPSIHHRG